MEPSSQSKNATGRDEQRLRVSIAMCTYNGARFLSEQLESFAAQTRIPDELVVCDDGSTDDTVSLIASYAKTVGFPVRLIRNSQKLGPAKNFEKAIGLCEGEIIILSDQDDIWLSRKIETLVEAFAKHPKAVYAFSDAELVDEKGRPLGHSLWNAFKLYGKHDLSLGARQLELLLYENFLTGATMAFRASFRDIALPISTGWMHDYWFGLLGSTISHGIPIPEPLIKYRRHAAQVCGVNKRTYWEEWKVSMNAGAENARRKLKEFQELLGRLNSSVEVAGFSIARLELLKQKEFHLLQRAKFRSCNWISRCLHVIIEALTGRYSRFSNSPWNSIFRDLCP